MKRALNGFGVKSIFNPDISSPMVPSTSNKEFDFIFQDTILEADEDGTHMDSVVQSKWHREYPFMRFDHPFLFLITREKDKAILFCGIIRDPTPSR